MTEKKFAYAFFALLVLNYCAEQHVSSPHASIGRHNDALQVQWTSSRLALEWFRSFAQAPDPTFIDVHIDGTTMLGWTRARSVLEASRTFTKAPSLRIGAATLLGISFHVWFHKPDREQAFAMWTKLVL